MSDSLWPCVWTIACQSPLPMGFSRQEYWSVLPFPPQGIFLTQGSNPRLLHLLPWQANAWLLSSVGSKEWIFSPLYKINKYISISISFTINRPCQRVVDEWQLWGVFFIYALGRLQDLVLEGRVFVIIKGLDGCESEWTPGDGDGQGGLACCGSWGRKESDTTERLNWTELNN